ncbi:NADP oxidoreductase coenzyme F420-dependent [Zopfochytrium polystomum]|nr:NADP oxidoreductase coenzyme F420-dependent [Zopfochytrium polystomum]
MATTKTTTIGLIGYGSINSVVARHAVAAGYRVLLSNSRGPATLADAAAALGPLATAVSVADAIRNSDIVSLSIPLKAAFDDAAFPADAFAGKIVVETLNYYPERDGRFPQLDAREITSSELLQRRFKSARLVKAFNNIYFKHLENLARPKGHPGRSALPIAGDDADAKAKVSAFVEDIGFDAVDVGSFADSWRSEPNTPVYAWPYFAKPPEGLSEEEKAKWFFEGHGGSVVSAADVKALLGKATKDSPVGGVLPKSLS